MTCEGFEIEAELTGARSRVIAAGRRIREVTRLINQYPGSRAENWAKKSTPVFDHPATGQDTEVHWYENMSDGVGKVEPKFKDVSAE